MTTAELRPYDPAQQREICPPVSDLFGDEPVLARELMTDPSAPSAVADATEQLSWAHARGPEDVETGTAQRAALRTLGCEACVLAGCQVAEALDTQATTAESEVPILRVVDQLLSAPTWLKAARARAFGEDRMKSLADNRSAVREAIKSGNLDPVELLGGVESAFLGTADARSFPELAGINTVSDPQNPLERHLIQPGERSKPPVEVIDATSAIPQTVDPAPREEQGVMTQKLLGRIVNVDKEGQPLILDPDNTMQKVLRTQPGGPGKLCELRMTGKNRMYVSVTPPKDGEPTRVIILGSHGGDEATQNAFINALLKPDAVDLRP